MYNNIFTMPNPSATIPTFEDYMNGKTSINPQLILTAPEIDRNISNTKLAELTENITNLIQDLRTKCSKYSVLTVPQKEACNLQKENHEHNLQIFVTLHRDLLKSTPKNAGSRRKTTKGRRKQNKSRRNRKSRR